jgi:3-hydroxyacyl-[acyl-carrier-protein] dehydratase
MRFRQLDSIVDLQPGSEITAVRTLSGDDRFYRDHFPNFPVLPGVLTLEMMFQASQWLMHKTDGFSHSLVLLKQARNVKFSSLLEPGETVNVSAQIRKMDERDATLIAQVTTAKGKVASGRLTVERTDLASLAPCRAAMDGQLRRARSLQFEALDPHSATHQAVSPTSFRWMWIDRIIEFKSGSHATAIKAVSLSEEPVDMYVPHFPVMPCSLVIEGLAQLSGMLISEINDFARPLVLAKVGKAIFHRPARPGDTMTYSVEITDIEPEGALAVGTSHIDGQLHAEVELFFAYVEDFISDASLMDPADIRTMTEIIGLYDVGTTATGEPLSSSRELA